MAVALALSGCASQGNTGSDASDYPKRTIQLVVPWSAGGDTDAIMRLIAQGLQKRLDQNVVVKNVSGGGGTVGATQVLNAENDGYTLLAGHDSIAMSRLLGKTDFGYFDFEPIALMTSTYSFVATHPSSPWDNMKELVADAKKRPGKIGYGASIGSTSQLAPASIQAATGIRLNVVGYQGTAEREKALVSNHLDLGNVSVASAHQYLQAGKLKLLGYFGPKRSDAVPDVPTLKEQGIDVAMATNRGLFAPKGTPKPIIKKVSKALHEVANSKRFTSKIEKLGTQMNFKGYKSYPDWLRQNKKQIRSAMKRSGMLD